MRISNSRWYLAAAGLAILMLSANTHAQTLFWNAGNTDGAAYCDDETGSPDALTGEGRIYRGDINGSPSTIIVGGLDRPAGMVVNPNTQKVYWADFLNEVIQRSNYDGTGVETLFSTNGVDNDNSTTYPNDLAIDVAGGNLYYADLFNNYFARSDLDGNNPVELFDFTTGDDEEIDGIALDVAGGYFYYTEWYEGRLRRIRVNGTGDEMLGADFGNCANDSPNDNFCTHGVALDPVNAKVYVTTWSPAEDDGCTAFNGRIYRSNLDGSNREQVLSNVPMAWPWGMVVDGTNDVIYWTDIREGTVTRANLDGTGVQVLYSGLVTPQAITMLGQVAAEPEPTDVPTLNRTGLLIFVLLLAVTAAFFVRRQA